MEDSMFQFPFIILVIILGAIVAVIADNKGKNPILWFFYGALIFIVAFIHVLATAPNQEVLEQRKLDAGDKKRCPFCAEVINKDAKICRFCKKELLDDE